ncbi:M28 family peptidase [Algoriphagus boritolerans]|uniref:M28 family peptidase n=1 Tax=Algoriphagus boritolerans TaxID=308111 RepID=UPI002FCE062A
MRKLWENCIKKGQKPSRSILIGHWDAEEQGVIGSTEWVEHLKKRTRCKGNFLYEL